MQTDEKNFLKDKSNLSQNKTSQKLKRIKFL